MSDSPTAESPYVFTIGHSNHSIDTFLSLLQPQGIKVIVDVRSQPYSRYSPHFSKDPLTAALGEAGVGYCYLGKELGGRPEGDAYYDSGGHVLYARVAASPQFIQGIAQLCETARDSRVAILCSEENPAGCHRHLLIGRVLIERGVTVRHIRSDGRVETEVEAVAVKARLRRRAQPPLIEAWEEDSWTSIRSVSPRKAPPSSSAHSKKPG